ncbi:myotrophin [Salarias fasciatus]|uniref:Uncharacterized protein n=1 Tax=Salarias fasciatus TaxID=181472 RepID=A0A672F7L6_SALFA|nr:myotrophin [Salarias fasciatus]
MGDNAKDEGLMWALKAGDMEEVRSKVLTSEDANRTLDSSSGRKPLHYAADFGQLEVLQFLIQMGADINATDSLGLTPLITACYEGHRDSVKLLLEKGAKKDLKATNGATALEAADNDDIKQLLK